MDCSEDALPQASHKIDPSAENSHRQTKRPGEAVESDASERQIHKLSNPTCGHNNENT